MDGPDDKVQLRRIRQQPLRPGQVPDGLAQLDAQPQRQLSVPVLPGGGVLRRKGRPVIVVPQRAGTQQNGFHVVGEADLVQPRLCGCPGHLRHGVTGVGGDAGVGMVIGKITHSTHFLNFLKNFFCSS